jgi:hypothetical protein
LESADLVIPDLVVRLTQEILDCACAALEKTACGCPSRALVSVGAVAWDSCCDGGQLWVGVERIFAYNQFPVPATTVMCMPPLAADLVVGVLRCAPVMTDQGDAPSPEVLTASAAQIYEDAYTVNSAVLCCLSEHHRARPFVMGPQRPVGPAGGCVGTELRFTVALTDPPLVGGD